MRESVKTESANVEPDVVPTLGVNVATRPNVRLMRLFLEMVVDITDISGKVAV